MTGKIALKRTAFLIRETWNRLRYGPEAPRYAELLWVRPGTVRQALVGCSRYGTCSGQVIDLRSGFSRKNLYDTPRIRSCFDHWTEGLPWEETADYKMMIQAVRSGKDWAGCRTEEEVEKRFVSLDRAFDQVRREGRLRTRREIDPRNFREEGGVLMCIGPSGEPLLFDGFHRMAIALILGLPIMPVQVGYVDPAAIGLLRRYRVPFGPRVDGQGGVAYQP